MVAELDYFASGKARMAYRGEVPWHREGSGIDRTVPLQDWITLAGMGFDYELVPVSAQIPTRDPITAFTYQDIPNRRAVIRNDTRAILNVVSDRFKLVQPRETILFFEDLLTEAGGDFEMETAGVLKEGKVVWGMAKCGLEALRIKGMDEVRARLLMMTSVDYSMPTTARFVAERVVCSNTMTVALNEKTPDKVSVHHHTEFDPKAVKMELGIFADAWAAFDEAVQALSERTVKPAEVRSFLIETFGDSEIEDDADQPGQQAMKNVYRLFRGQGKGMNLAGSHQTAWGLVNAVTEHVDHYSRAHNADNRAFNAVAGPGEKVKRVALASALKLVA